MKINYSPYVLKKKSSGESLSDRYSPGVLLKVEWPDGVIGFSDLHPLPAFGDLEVSEELDQLRSGRLSQISEQSLWLARRDGEARKSKKKLWLGVENLRNNFLITKPNATSREVIKKAYDEGFRIAKVKISTDFEKEMVLLKTLVEEGFQLRLDANSKMDFKSFLKFSINLDKLVCQRVLYIEDPMEYAVQKWQQGSGYLKLAADFEKNKIKWDELKSLKSNQMPLSALVLKPSRDRIEKHLESAVDKKIKLTVTSSMDHCVGAMHALCLVAELAKKYDSLVQDPGCLTFLEYESEMFSEQILTTGPFVHYKESARGFGIGFDQLFSELPWTRLSGNPT